MTLHQLRARADYWRIRLNLKEWSIKVRWATAAESRKNHGACTWNAEELLAEIYISRTTSIEETLVHELAHLILDGHKDMEDWNHSTEQERAINRIAAALVGE